MMVMLDGCTLIVSGFELLDMRYILKTGKIPSKGNVFSFCDLEITWCSRCRWLRNGYSTSSSCSWD